MTSRDVRRAIAAACIASAFGCAMAPSGRRGPVYAEEPTVRTETTPVGEATKTAESTSAGAGVATTSPATVGGPEVSTKKAPTPSPSPPPPTATSDASKADAPRAAVRPSAPPMKEEPEALVSGGSSAGGSSAAPAPVAPVILQGPPAVQIAAAQANLDDATRQLGSAGGDCAKLCKALASMQRATERLCGLVAGSTDVRRCTDARSRLTAATAKVNATCGGCGT